MTVYYKMRQILLQNATAILLLKCTLQYICNVLQYENHSTLPSNETA